jgi:hypothetical protein
MSDYAKIVSAAEAAVATLADEKLKVIAFTEILKHQLHTTHQETQEASNGKSRGRTKRTKHAASANSDTGGKSRSGLPAWLLEMKDEGFFKDPRSQKSIHAELISRSHHIPPTSLPACLGKLVRAKHLRRIKKPDEDEKQRWHWSNW